MVPDARQERGQLLAQAEDKRIKQVDGPLWFVPSEKSGGYLVNAETGACSCPDAQQGQRGTRCKHFWAIEFVRAARDGTVVVVPTAKVLPKSGLTVEERRHITEALNFLRIRCGSWQTLAKALRCHEKTLTKTFNRRPASAGLAVKVARLAGVLVDDVLAGKFPPPGTCPHCGRGPG